MNIAFRVDGNKRLGLGHVKRCMVLAKKIQKKNINCFFITQFEETINLLQDNKFQSFLIKQKNEFNEINKILKNNQCTKLVIDSKRKSILKILKNKNLKIILIDNLNYSKKVKLVVISSVKNAKKIYPKNCIVGKQFVLHGIEKTHKPISTKSNQILVSMGGSDKYNITEKIIKAFSKNSQDFQIKIVVGKFFDENQKIIKIINNDKRLQIVKNPSSLVSLMQQSSIGITTFGVTTYEAAICKLPLITIAHSNENDHSAKLVEELGWIKHFGKYDDIDYKDLVQNTIKLMRNKKELSKMKKSCLQIDGLGPSRVAKQIIDL